MVLTMTGIAHGFQLLARHGQADHDLTAQNSVSWRALTRRREWLRLETNGALQVFNGAEDAAAAKDYVRRAAALGMPVDSGTHGGWPRPSAPRSTRADSRFRARPMCMFR